MKKKRVLILSARTGGGHRAAAEAVIAALQQKYADKVEIDHLDFLEFAPRPFRDAPRYYSQIVRVPPAYGTIFRLTEGKKQAQFAIDTIARRYSPHIEQLLLHHPADVIVSFHFGANTMLPVIEAMGLKTPFVTVVTDLATGHPMWFDSRASECIVPSQEAYARARMYKMPASKLKILGLPIKPEFAKRVDRAKVAKQLGWPTDKPTILIMAGGDGMGKIASLTRRLDNSKIDAHLAVIAGRNTKLADQLKARKWKKQVQIYGFCDNVAEMMQGSSVLLTKAGPGTIVEAMVSRLPIVLYDFLPGQEEGNIEYLINHQAGLWASTNSIAARATSDILHGYASIGGGNFDKAAELHTQAADKIAAAIMKY